MATAQSFVSLSLTSVAPTEERRGAIVSNTTSGNVARDTAVQINGHIAGKIYNLNFKTLVIHSQCSVVAKLASHQRQYVQTLSSNFNSRNPSKPRTQNCTEQPKHANDVSTLSKRQSQYLTLQSGSTGIKGPIRAIFSSECRGNYISARIVRRFTLRSYDDPTANTSMVVAGERNITPTRNYVALITPIGLGDDQSPHRFFVVEHCLQNFDILIGSDIITKLPALAKHDEPIGPIRPIRSKP